MANALDQDPLYFDTTIITGVKCPRLRAIKFDSTGGGSASIADHTTGHILWSTDTTCFDDINLTVPTPFLIDVTVVSGVVYIYLGSGPR